MRLVNLEGQPYDPGMAASALNASDFGPEDHLLIEQMNVASSSSFFATTPANASTHLNDFIRYGHGMSLLDKVH